MRGGNRNSRACAVRVSARLRARVCVCRHGVRVSGKRVSAGFLIIASERLRRIFIYIRRTRTRRVVYLPPSRPALTAFRSSHPACRQRPRVAIEGELPRVYTRERAYTAYVYAVRERGRARPREPLERCRADGRAGAIFASFYRFMTRRRRRVAAGVRVGVVPVPTVAAKVCLYRAHVHPGRARKKTKLSGLGRNFCIFFRVIMILILSRVIGKAYKY